MISFLTTIVYLSITRTVYACDVFNDLKGCFDDVFGDIGDIANHVKGALDPLFNDIGNQIGAVTGDVVREMGSTFNDLGNQIGAVTDDVVDGVESMFEDIEQGVTGIAGEIESLFVGSSCETKGETLLNDAGPIPASNGNLVGHIPIKDTMVYRMEVQINSLPSWNSGWHSVFHCGDGDRVRMPIIKLNMDPKINGFYVRFSNDENWDSGLDHSFDLHAGQSYKLTIQVTQTGIMLWINDQRYYAGNFPSHSLIDSIPCYVGDPWFPAADVVISNLHIYQKYEVCKLTNHIGTALTSTFETVSSVTNDAIGTVDDHISAIGDELDEIVNKIGNLPQELLEALSSVFSFDLDNIINDDVKSLANTLETCIDSLSPLNVLQGLESVMNEIIPLDVLNDIDDTMKDMAYTIIAIPLSQNKDSMAVIEHACGSIDAVLAVAEDYFSSLSSGSRRRMQTNNATMPTRRGLLEKECTKDVDGVFCVKWNFEHYINNLLNTDYQRGLNAWPGMIPNQTDWANANTIANYKAIKNSFSTLSTLMSSIATVISTVDLGKLDWAESGPVLLGKVQFWLYIGSTVCRFPADIFTIALEYADLHNGYIVASRSAKIMHNSDAILHNQLELRDMISKINRRRMIGFETESNMIRFEMNIEELLIKAGVVLFIAVISGLFIGLSIGYFVWNKKSSNVETGLIAESSL